MENRTLCDDGTCIGVVGDNGCCKVCGKLINYPHKMKKKVNQEWSRRTLCIDGNYIGIIGNDGKCKSCGKVYIPGNVAYELNKLPKRILCDDGRCIGILDNNGRCKECGTISTKHKEHRLSPLKTNGYIYILTNPSLPPNYLKIGKTERHPQLRVIELSLATGIPTPFEIAFLTSVSDCHKAESMVHARLKFCRVASNREFFEFQLEKAIEVIKELKTIIEKNLSAR